MSQAQKTGLAVAPLLLAVVVLAWGLLGAPPEASAPTEVRAARPAQVEHLGTSVQMAMLYLPGDRALPTSNEG